MTVFGTEIRKLAFNARFGEENGLHKCGMTPSFLKHVFLEDNLVSLFMKTGLKESVPLVLF